MLQFAWGHNRLEAHLCGTSVAKIGNAGVQWSQECGGVECRGEGRANMCFKIERDRASASGAPPAPPRHLLSMNTPKFPSLPRPTNPQPPHFVSCTSPPIDDHPHPINDISTSHPIPYFHAPQYRKDACVISPVGPPAFLKPNLRRRRKRSHRQANFETRTAVGKGLQAFPRTLFETSTGLSAQLCRRW